MTKLLKCSFLAFSLFALTLFAGCSDLFSSRASKLSLNVSVPVARTSSGETDGSKNITCEDCIYFVAELSKNGKVVAFDAASINDFKKVEFSFDDIPAGKYTLSVTAYNDEGGSVTAKGEAEIVIGSEEKSIDIVLKHVSGGSEPGGSDPTGGEPPVTSSSFAELKTQIENLTGTKEIVLDNTSYRPASGDTKITVKSGVNLTLTTGSGTYFYRTENFLDQPFFEVENGASLVLKGSSSANLNFDGQAVIESSNAETPVYTFSGTPLESTAPLIVSYGHLEIGEKCILQNNYNKNTTGIMGGAIYAAATDSSADGSVSLKINGGTIQGCVCTKNGGGIYVSGTTSKAVSLELNKGKITGNIAGNMGGGIFISNGTGTIGEEGRTPSGDGTADFVVTDNKAIGYSYEDQKASYATSAGGGLYVTGGLSDVKMNSGCITNNSAYIQGGGLSVNYGKFYYYGGKIGNNNIVNTSSVAEGAQVCRSKTGGLYYIGENAISVTGLDNSATD